MNPTFPAIFSLIQEFALFREIQEKVKIPLSQMQQDKHLFKCLVAQNSKGAIEGFAIICLLITPGRVGPLP